MIALFATDRAAEGEAAVDATTPAVRLPIPCVEAYAVHTYTQAERTARAHVAIRELAVERGYAKIEAEWLFDPRNFGWVYAAADVAWNYEGTFDYLVQARERVREYGTLGVALAKGVLNCVIADARREARQAAAATAPAVDIEAVIAAKVAAGTKFDFEEVTPALVAVAVGFAQAYGGSFGFMQDMRIAARGGRLSVGQAKGVLNCLLADRRRAAATRPVVADQPQAAESITFAREIGDGSYTVVLDDGSHVTLRIRTAKSKKYQNVALLVGSDNTGDYVSFGGLTGTGFRFWRDVAPADFARQRAALDVLLGSTDVARAEAGKAYALASGNCYICNRLLTTPESIADGIGPVCAAK